MVDIWTDLLNLRLLPSQQAIEQARLTINSDNSDDVGVILGNCVAGLAILSEQHRLLLDRGPDRVSPFLAPTMTCDAPSIQLSLLLGAKGINFAVSSMCSSSSDAIGQAFELSLMVVPKS